MVDMMRKDHVKSLSAEGRVRNSYEALYYNAKSGDPETDDIMRSQMQQAFRNEDVLLADSPDDERLRDVMLNAYKSSTGELQGSEINPEQSQTLERDFDAFTDNHPQFYASSFDAYEKKYDGEPVDFAADYDRMIQANNGVNPYEPEPTGDDLDLMEQEANQAKPSRLNRAMQSGMKHANHALDPDTKTNKALRTGLTAAVMATPQGKVGKAAVVGAGLANKAFEPESSANKIARSGLSYAGHVPEAKAQASRRSYQQVKQEEAAAAEIKGQDFDEKYDQYSRNYDESHQKTSAGDDYGFDEHDYELEDDGPDL